jgi:hypothetical protein
MTAAIKGSSDAPTPSDDTISRAEQRSLARAKALRHHMTESLQGTKELSALQERLLNSLTQGVGLDGLHYHHEDLHLDIQLGQQATHSCGYRLLCADGYLGEIVFKRSRRFTEREMQLIESVIPALVNPLRDSLREQTAASAG